eukprot:12686478-Ditylum_brightwellii.AAC.1
MDGGAANDDDDIDDEYLNSDSITKKMLERQKYVDDVLSKNNSSIMELSTRTNSTQEEDSITKRAFDVSLQPFLFITSNNAQLLSSSTSSTTDDN